MKFIVILSILFTTVLAQPVDLENDISSRIVGGSAAAKNQHKYVAAIFYRTLLGSYFCQGVLISPSWVLTSGNCIFNAISFNIQLGSDLRTQADANRALVTTTHSNLPLGFDPLFYRNDIGLIRFNAPFSYTANIERILLPTAPTLVGDMVTAVGWGQVSYTNNNFSEQLQQVALQVVDIQDCRNVLGTLNIHSDSLCVASPNNNKAGPCVGDSGAPLLQNIRIGESVHPVGVFSFLKSGQCGGHGTQVYTNVTAHLDWIKYMTGLK